MTNYPVMWKDTNKNKKQKIHNEKHPRKSLHHIFYGQKKQWKKS